MPEKEYTTLTVDRSLKQLAKQRQSRERALIVPLLGRRAHGVYEQRLRLLCVPDFKTGGTSPRTDRTSNLCTI